MSKVELSDRTRAEMKRGAFVVRTANAPDDVKKQQAAWLDGDPLMLRVEAERQRRGY